MLGPALLLKLAVATELLARHALADPTPLPAPGPDPDFMPYYKSTTQMAREKGMEVKKYEVHTADGYHLSLHRLMGGSRYPVLLIHGLLASSDQWLIIPEGYAMVLANAGYDVWMGNLRGNVYSHEHDVYSPDYDLQFWNFTLHEMAYYDLPAMIDQVIETTGHKHLFYSGYSIGGTLFLMMGASRPDYAEKIKGAFLMAPLVVHPSMDYLTTPLRMLFEFMFVFVRMLKENQVGEFYPRQADWLKVMEETCGSTSQTFPLCVRLIQDQFDLMTSEYDVTKLQFLLKSFGSGSSTKAIEHMMQIVQSGRLQQYSFGPLENMVTYGSYKPPEYDLSKIKCPVALYYNKNDPLIDYKAVELVGKSLPCILCDCVSNNKGFSHFGYVISNKADSYVFQRALKGMRMLETDAAWNLGCR